ncbi:MAG: hypothetical protein ACUVXI_16505 [bacterium]
MFKYKLIDLLIAIFGIVVIVSFFLPWVSSPEIEGYRAARQVGATGILYIFSLGGEERSLRSAYLVPAFGLLLILLAGVPNKAKKMEVFMGTVFIVLGILPLLYGAYRYITLGEAAKSSSPGGIGSGIYGIAIGLLGAAFGGALKILFATRSKRGAEKPPASSAPDQG